MTGEEEAVVGGIAEGEELRAKGGECEPEVGGQTSAVSSGTRRRQDGRGRKVWVFT